MSLNTFLKVTGDYISNGNNQIRAKESCSYMSVPKIDSDINKQLGHAIIGNTNIVGRYEFGNSTCIISNTKMGADTQCNTLCWA